VFAPLTDSPSQAALDRLEHLLDQARHLPLSDHVVVDPETLSRSSAEIDAAITAEFGDRADANPTLLAGRRELDRVLASAAAMPLTRRVRVNQAAVLKVITELSAGVAVELGRDEDLDWTVVELAERERREELERLWWRPMLAAEAITVAGGVALGSAVDPALYAIAAVGGTSLVVTVLFRAWAP
jgi:hypothetical protein